jgi:hypothetical protein
MANVLEKTLRRLPAAKKIKGQMLIDAWPEAVGEKIACKTCAVSFHDGTLHVWVRDSVWAQHIALHKKKIIGTLNSLVRTKMLHDVRFRVGGISPTAVKSLCLAPDNPDWRAQTLDQQDILIVEAALAETGLDADLRTALRKLLTSQRKLVRYYFTQGYRPCCSCGLPAEKLTGEAYCRCCRL